MLSHSHAIVPSARILVVEDSPTQAQRLEHLLEQHGHEVDVASNGKIALDMARQRRPSLVLSDIVMPEMDGYELTRRLKAQLDLRDIPVILVTTMSEPEDVILGLECGADNFVLKPYDERYLVSRVHYMLMNREYLRLTQDAAAGIELNFNDKRHYITADRLQILNLLLSTYEAATQRNRDLRRSQEELEKRSAEVASTNRFLDSLIENIPNMVFIKDVPDLRFIHLNRAGEVLLGRPRSEVLGKTDHELFPREEADHFETEDRQVLARGTVGDIPEEVIHTLDKGVRILHTKKVPVLDERGKARHLLGISEDVTEQRAMEKEISRLSENLAERAAHLEASNRELESFSYSVSHDLRSPLGSIDGFAQALQERCGAALDDQGRRYLGLIRANAKRMSTLIDELLEFSKLSRRPVVKENTDMEAMLHEVIEAALQGSPPAPNKAEIDIGPLPAAQADAVLVRQVWANLISNAIKYSSKRAKPMIQISGHRLGDEVIYTVRDNGAGFDMAYYDRLFEVFQRVHHSREFEGSGIGLAIVQRIVVRHGGRVWAESKVDQGARFHFSLPAGPRGEGAQGSGPP
ncbi:MAG TPA: response regulator [Ramlibacter sp.]|nr:response regulator [Ramlibacter sp.]